MGRHCRSKLQQNAQACAQLLFQSRGTVAFLCTSFLSAEVAPSSHRSGDRPLDLTEMDAKARESWVLPLRDSFCSTEEMGTMDTEEMEEEQGVEARG